MTQKMKFLSPKKRNFMSQHNRQLFFAKTAPILVKYSLHSTIYNLQPHIGCRHPVLYFTIQVTEKYSAAMYYIFTRQGHINQVY